MLQPGTQIGRYEIQRRIARGGMGIVYVAHDPVLGRLVAIKVFLGDLDLPDAAERFTREARAAAALNHTNIVTIHDYGDVASQPYIVMEYIQGETLAEMIQRRTPVSLTEKLRWLEELCAGVDSAHKLDVIHRDIKPGNLMVDRAGRLKILDFGIAKMMGTLGGNATAVIGTPGYMSPEQLLGARIDHRSDLFSIGVVAFELLTYREAFAGDTFTATIHRIIHEDVPWLADLVPEAPPELCAVLQRTLHKSPADRFPDAESLRLAISRVRRQLDAMQWDASKTPTIIGTIPRPTVERGTGSARKQEPNGVSGAALTPPPDPAAEREARARALAAQVEGVLERGRLSLAQGATDQALDACRDAMALDGTHAGALEFEQQVNAALAKQRAGALLADARTEFQRGALTNCQSLLEQARQLDPEALDARSLERDLRLARVEQERLRHRAEAAGKMLADARTALQRGDVEAALAWAREALALDPTSTEGRQLESTAVARLEELTDATTVIALADVADAQTPVPAPAQAAPPRDTGEPIQPTPPPPLPGPAVPPGPAEPPAPRPDPLAGLRVGAASALAGASAITATVVARSRTLAATLRTQAGALASTLRTQAGTVGSFVLTKTRAMPRRQKHVIAGAVVLAALLAVAALALLTRPPAVPLTGVLVIEAIPWATVTAIEGQDGSNLLAAPAPTPLAQSVPAGRYTIEMSGPDAEARVLTIEVQADGTTVTPAERFQTLTLDEYFLPSLSAGAPEGEAGTGSEPTDEAAPAAEPPSQPSGALP